MIGLQGRGVINIYITCKYVCGNLTGSSNKSSSALAIMALARLSLMFHPPLKVDTTVDSGVSNPTSLAKSTHLVKSVSPYSVACLVKC